MNKISAPHITTVIIHVTTAFLCFWFFFPKYFSHRDLPNSPLFPNKTIEGVDTNQNGVRDEVEIAISRAIPHDDDLYASTMLFAYAYQKHLTSIAHNREEGLQIMRDTDCVDNHDMILTNPNNTDPIISPEWERRVDIEKLTLNTKERFDKARTGVYSKVGLAGGNETACGSTVMDRPF